MKTCPNCGEIFPTEHELATIIAEKQQELVQICSAITLNQEQAKATAYALLDLQKRYNLLYNK